MYVRVLPRSTRPRRSWRAVLCRQRACCSLAPMTFLSWLRAASLGQASISSVARILCAEWRRTPGRSFRFATPCSPHRIPFLFVFSRGSKEVVAVHSSLDLGSLELEVCVPLRTPALCSRCSYLHSYFRGEGRAFSLRGRSFPLCSSAVSCNQLLVLLRRAVSRGLTSVTHF